jgi:hypothetical protein
MQDMLRRTGTPILAVLIALLGLLAFRPAVAQAWQLEIANPKAVSAILIEPETSTRSMPICRARRRASPRSCSS